MSFTQEPDLDLSPVGSLALLWPTLAEDFAGPAERSRLEAAAERLAPIARIALELRLGEGEGDIDLHQFISRSAADASALTRYLSQLSLPEAGESLLRRFLQAWADDSGGVRTDLDGFFLEWDGPGPHAAAPPAIFLPVQGRHDHGAAATAHRRAIERHIEQLSLAGPEVGALLRAIPTHVSISYVGFMLGRGEAVRLNLRGVRPDDMARVLAALGWPGDAERATALFRTLVALTGQVAIALDFAPSIQPTIGFECVLAHSPAEEPRWGELLQWLCDEGLCTKEKAAGLQGVSARLYPEDEAHAWPAAWIGAALRAPARYVPWFEGRLSHVKLNIAADGAVIAKAYVSAQHHWTREAVASPPSAKAGVSPSPRNAMEAAARFLIAERQQDDFWRDFQLVNGESDEWVTAFVGYALATSGVPLPESLVPQTVQALLRRQRPEGGWGYNRISPADADSTAWALKFLEAAADEGPKLEAARAFLRSHLLSEGGLATYAAETNLRFGPAGIPTDDSGWRSGHLCVAANAAGLIRAPLVDHLISRQSPDGAWPAYWWRDDAFSTALAAESLEIREAAHESRLRAAAWARRRLAKATGAFERAWLLRLLCAGGDAAQARSLEQELVAEQRPDGSWDSSAEMLFPDPAERQRRDDAPIVRDGRRLFTTASVLLALGAARGLGMDQ